MEILIELVKTAPILAALIWYVLSRDKAERAERAVREKLQREEHATRDEQWQNFLRDQRMATLAVLPIKSASGPRM